LNFKNDKKFKGIDGIWNLQLNEGKSNTVNSVEYKVENNTSNIEIISAKSSPTSFNVNFAIDGKYINEKKFKPKNMKLIDENGKEYQSSGYSHESKDEKLIIATNFPLSSYDNVDKLTLIIESIGEVELEK
jgi:copper chaperone CopZ